jgi:spermidine synthase
MALDDDGWLIEVCSEAGSAFALELGPGGRLHRERSDYQTIEVFDTTWFGRAMVIDGFLMLAERDNFLYHEMLAHPVLFSHRDPRRVLIVGGGDCGTLREVCKHDGIEAVTQVDIDERVTRVAEEYFPALCAANSDPRVRLAFDDGIQWVRDTPDASLDVIIVDSTDPVGPGEALFTEAFYRECHRALAEGGLIVQQSESPLAHLAAIIAPMYRNLASAGFGQPTSFHFPQPVYPTGWWTATAARKGGAVTFERAGAAEASALHTEYYTADIHRGAMAQPAFVQRALTPRR